MVWAIMTIALPLILIGGACSVPPETVSSPETEQNLQTQTSAPIATSTGNGDIYTPQPNHNPTIIYTNSSPTIVADPTQTEDVTSLPFMPVVGGADKIAFIHQNEVWMANLDGKDLIQLTNDELPKSSLEWSEDNNGIFYIAGLCIYLVDIQSIQTSPFTCFDKAQRVDSFKLSPDYEQAAISLDGQLYVVPFLEDELGRANSSQDLGAMADCETLAPYKHRASMVTVRKARWSADGNQLAILRQAYDDDQQVEEIHLINITNCSPAFPRLDEFPATRFEMEGYDHTPIIQDFAWDGADIFALTSFKRNDGFGDLWMYSTKLHRGYMANPIDGKCCYRDPVFSPDGKYLAFAFQDASLVSRAPTVLYYMPYATLESGLVYPPIALPIEFFTEPRTKPQLILRPAR